MSSSSTDHVSSSKTASERELEELRAKLAAVTAERDVLRRAYEELLTKHKLLKHQLYVAKAERIDVAQLELEFKTTSAALDELQKSLGIDPTTKKDDDAHPDRRKRPRPGRPGVARRDLSQLDLPKERIEITDPALEGKAERIGFEESYRLGYRKPSRVCIVVAVAKYKVERSDGTKEFVTAERPREIVKRAFLAPSMVSHLLATKYLMGVPFFRIEEQCEREGFPLDRGTMCRYAEEVGTTLGSIVEAARKEAMGAFCLSTDATGVSIQPAALPDKSRQACSRGHFFVVLADRDHVFLEYQAKHDSNTVCEMFRGFSGYVQADAHVIYDALYRGEANVGLDPPIDSPTEVGCWAHARRKFWEAAMAKHPVGGEGTLRIRKLFALDAQWAKEPPQKRQELRQKFLAPMIAEFFLWTEAQYALSKGERGLVSTALGYAVRQKGALTTFLADGRLRMDNNASERALRHIAVGRKAWLFFGSDDHAKAAGNLFSLIASCKLHGLDPETYLAEMIRVHPQWPLDRHLELAPKYWPRTRARLDPAELARELGPLTIPPPA